MSHFSVYSLMEASVQPPAHLSFCVSGPFPSNVGSDTPIDDNNDVVNDTEKALEKDPGVNSPSNIERTTEGPRSPTTTTTGVTIGTPPRPELPHANLTRKVPGSDGFAIELTPFKTKKNKTPENGTPHNKYVVESDTIFSNPNIIAPILNESEHNLVGSPYTNTQNQDGVLRPTKELIAQATSFFGCDEPEDSELELDGEVTILTLNGDVPSDDDEALNFAESRHQHKIPPPTYYSSRRYETAGQLNAEKMSDNLDNVTQTENFVGTENEEISCEAEKLPRPTELYESNVDETVGEHMKVLTEANEEPNQESEEVPLVAAQRPKVPRGSLVQSMVAHWSAELTSVPTTTNSSRSMYNGDSIARFNAAKKDAQKAEKEALERMRKPMYCPDGGRQKSTEAGLMPYKFGPGKYSSFVDSFQDRSPTKGKTQASTVLRNRRSAVQIEEVVIASKTSSTQPLRVLHDNDNQPSSPSTSKPALTEPVVARMRQQWEGSTN